MTIHVLLLVCPLSYHFLNLSFNLPDHYPQPMFFP